MIRVSHQTHLVKVTGQDRTLSSHNRDCADRGAVCDIVDADLAIPGRGRQARSRRRPADRRDGVSRIGGKDNVGYGRRVSVGGLSATKERHVWCC